MSTSIEPIQLAISTRADPGRAWRYLTEPELVSRWFADPSPLGAVGDLYRIDFGDGSVVEGRIVAVEPGRTFAHEWAWLDAEPGPAAPTLVRWEVVASHDGGSEVRLVHGGWTDAGADENLRDDHESYWSGYLDDLQALLDEAAD